MECVNCAMRLQDLEDDLPGVVEVTASYRKLQMTVKYDEKCVNDSMIIEAVHRLGYTAEPFDDNR
jgi:copper chaperone CopZ